MRRKKPPKEDDLLAVLKKAILSVMADDKATPADRLKAIELGTKLAAIELRWSDPDAGKSFF